MSRVYCKSNYSKRQAVVVMLKITACILFALMFIKLLFDAKLAEDTAAALTREQFRNDQLELRLQDLEKENRLLQQDVAILHNILTIGDYTVPEE